MNMREGWYKISCWVICIKVIIFMEFIIIFVVKWFYSVIVVGVKVVVVRFFLIFVYVYVREWI